MQDSYYLTQNKKKNNSNKIEGKEKVDKEENFKNQENRV